MLIDCPMPLPLWTAAAYALPPSALPPRTPNHEYDPPRTPGEQSSVTINLSMEHVHVSSTPPFENRL